MTDYVDIKGMDHLDSSPDARLLIESMQRIANCPDVVGMKDRSVALLRLQPGQVALEVGCGHGIDALRMASAVGEQGRVVGVDSSAMMIDLARSLSDLAQLEYRVVAGHPLPFEDASFDAVHADRLLISQKEPGAVFADLVRLVKPGGRMSLTDLDVPRIGLHPYSSPWTESILSGLVAAVQNPTIGRDLVDLFVEHGFEEIEVLSESWTVRDFDFLNGMLRFDLLLGADGQPYLDILRDASAEGRFLYTAPHITVAGRKSGPMFERCKALV